MANISTLTISLVADTAKFANGLKKARSNSQKFSKAIGGAFKLAAAGAAALVAGLGALIVKSLALVDQQRKTARTLGTTQAVFAGLSLAAGIAGVSTESFTKALKRQSKSIVDANDGLQTQARAFERLGLDTKKLIDLPVEKQFGAITTALGKVENSTLKVAIASDIFGAKNADLINILELGEEGLDNFIKKAKELGVALTEDQTAAIEGANDAVLVFKTSLTGLGNQLAARFAPLITAGAEALTNFTKAITDAVPQMAAFITNLFGIRRELAQLTLEDVAAELVVITRENEEAQNALATFEEQISGFSDTAIIDAKQLGGFDKLVAKVQETEKRFNDLIRRRRELKKVLSEETTTGGGDSESDGIDFIDIKAIQALRMEVTPELEAFRARVKIATADAARIFAATRTPIQNFIIEMGKAREALNIGDLSQEAFDTFREQLLDTLVGTEEDFDEFTKNIESFADQAARNMQDAFADFFFEPFDDGLSSLVSGFADALKRMVANLIASDILSFLNPQGGGGFFGFVKSIFGRQIGGPVGAGQSVVVGERGREVFTPGASGAVRPLGGINFAPVTNISGGAGLDVDKLIPILEENNRKVQGEFIDSLRRGKFA